MRILGKTLLANAQPTSALAILLPLMDVPTLGDPDLGVSIGECYRLIPGQEEMSIGTFEAVLAVCPERGDVRTALCDLYRQQGLLEKAAAVLKQENVQWPTPTVQPERHPPYPADEVFQGLFAWDSTLPLPEIETGGSRSLLHLRGDTAIRRRKSKRRVRRVRRFIAYSEAQMNAVQQDYHRIMRLCVGSNEAANLRQARQLAAPLIEDMMSNPSLRPADKQAVRTTDLSLLHGLTISEWFDLLCRYLVVECHVGSVERALKFTRIFLSRSVFHLDSYTSVVLRLLHLGIAQQTGSNSAVLQATRWFIRVWSDLPLSSNLLTKAMANCPPDTIDAPFLRFLERLAARHPERPLVQASNLALMLYTERYESAIRTGYVLLAKCANHPMGLLATAVALLHQSAKRTCRAPGLLQRRAFALIHHYRNIVGISGDYNVARAYHMMGKPELAVTYYRRALKSPLRTAAAFNLHLLFIQAGEHALAAHYLAKYLAVV
jgi:tetratricopeptide (TPR) repeat protein